MPLSVIGAGFGRTGTESLKRALDILDLGPCYHMFEVLPHQERVDQWIDIAQGGQPNWEKIFNGYRATVDWPGAYYWKELSQHYPDARVILSVRDSESWYKSFANTILPILRDRTYRDAMGDQLLVPLVFGGDIDDADHIVAAYEQHNQTVRETIAPDRLLEYELGSGWEPLCNFLNVPVPAEPYPRGNATAQFGENLSQAHAQRLGPES